MLNNHQTHFDFNPHSFKRWMKIKCIAFKIFLVHVSIHIQPKSWMKVICWWIFSEGIVVSIHIQLLCWMNSQVVYKIILESCVSIHIQRSSWMREKLIAYRNRNQLVSILIRLHTRMKIFVLCILCSIYISIHISFTGKMKVAVNVLYQ